MKRKSDRLPDNALVGEIVQSVMGESALMIERFPTGACHFVYDVITESQGRIVVRIARPENKALLTGTLYWHGLLRAKGVPLPNILYADLKAETSPFPYLIIERLAGEDLGIVYPQLSKEEKKHLASEIARIQASVGTLPPGRGFGFVSSYESQSFQRTWLDVVKNSLERSRRRIEAVGMIDPGNVDRVVEKAAAYEDYFSRVKQRCFLDDTTTRNVIIHDGKLSGIVDLDCVCFGDNILPIALTRMSLLNSGYDTDYTDFWCEAAHLAAEQEKVLNFYTALFCVDFMGELGQTFNKENPQPVEMGDVERLSGILDELLEEI